MYKSAVGPLYIQLVYMSWSKVSAGQKWEQ